MPAVGIGRLSHGGNRRPARGSPVEPEVPAETPDLGDESGCIIGSDVMQSSIGGLAITEK